MLKTVWPEPCAPWVATLFDPPIVHEAEGHFLPTRVMFFGELPAARQKSVSLVFLACGCHVPRLVRAPRSPWMYLLPTFRLYKCGRCGTKVLRRRLPNCSPYPLQLRRAR